MRKIIVLMSVSFVFGIMFGLPVIMNLFDLVIPDKLEQGENCTVLNNEFYIEFDELVYFNDTLVVYSFALNVVQVYENNVFKYSIRPPDTRLELIAGDDGYYLIDSRNIIYAYSYDGCKLTSPIIRPVTFETENLIRTGTFQRRLTYIDDTIYIDSLENTIIRVVTKIGSIGFVISSLMLAWNIYVEKVKKK